MKKKTTTLVHLSLLLTALFLAASSLFYGAAAQEDRHQHRRSSHIVSHGALSDEEALYIKNRQLLYYRDEFGDRGELVTVDPSLVFENDRLRNAYIALQALKQAILSDPFNITGNWVGSNVCKYTGVFCTKVPTRTESKPIQVETEPAKADKTGWIKPQGALPLSLFGEEQEEDFGAGESKVGDIANEGFAKKKKSRI